MGQIGGGGDAGPFYREAGRLPEPYRYWSEVGHVAVAVDLVRDERANSAGLSDWNLFRFAISNITGEVARKMFSRIEYTELHSTRAVLLVHPRPEEPEERLAAKLAELGRNLIDAVKSCLEAGHSRRDRRLKAAVAGDSRFHGRSVPGHRFADGPNGTRLLFVYVQKGGARVPRNGADPAG